MTTTEQKDQAIKDHNDRISEIIVILEAMMIIDPEIRDLSDKRLKAAKISKDAKALQKSIDQVYDWYTLELQEDREEFDKNRTSTRAETSHGERATTRHKQHVKE